MRGEPFLQALLVCITAMLYMKIYIQNVPNKTGGVQEGKGLLRGDAFVS